jgi:SAM-dependent methyltransferase
VAEPFATPPSNRWYEEAFRSDYRRVYAHRNLDAAREEVRFLLELGVHGRVLDLCCGFGRHALALAERGVGVSGLDLSFELLREARTLPGAELLRGRLVRADAGALPFANRSFDSVVNLFSSFGYFGELGDQRMLGEIARVLGHPGMLVLDLMNPDFVRGHLEPESCRENEDFLLRERRALTDGGRSVTKEVELRLEHGEVRTWREHVRIYEESELRALLADRGLRIVARHGAFDGRDLSASSPRMILVCRPAAKGS